MVRSDRISGFFWLVFAILMAIESYHLELGTLHQPGPGFLFFYVNIILAMMSLFVLARAWFAKDDGLHPSIFAGQNIPKIVLVLLSLFVYALLMERLGFIIVTLLLFIYLLGIIERKKWWVTGLMSLVVTVIAYLIFETWLQSQLPRGLLEFLRI